MGEHIYSAWLSGLRMQKALVEKRLVAEVGVATGTWVIHLEASSLSPRDISLC